MMSSAMNGAGGTRLGEFVVARDAQREIKLEPRPFRQLLGRLRAAVGAERDQRLALPVRLVVSPR